MSMQRLHCLVVDEIYPGHGRVSRNPREDLERAIEETRLLLEESFEGELECYPPG